MIQSNDSIRDALIVAGGRGTRLQPLTYDVLKPLVPFCGKPFLAGVIRRLNDAGVTRVHLVVGSETAPFDVLQPLAQQLGVELSYVPEPEPLDTAGGVRSVAEDLTGPVLVLNGDILTDVDYAAVAGRHVEADADATIVLTEVDDTSSYGVAVREGTRIVEFVEKPEPGSLPGHDTVNAGTYVIEPHVMLAHEPGRLSFERDVFPSLLARGGRIEGFVWDGVWQDLGTPERYRDGHRQALDGELGWPAVRDVPEREPGVRIADGAQVEASAQLVAPVLILDGARIGPGARVGPHAVVGARGRIGRDAEISGRAVLHDDVVIGDGVIAIGLIAGEAAEVQAGARLGRDVVLGGGEVVPAGDELEDEERRPHRRDF